MNNEVVRKSVLVTLSEIIDGERALQRAGIDVCDPEDWHELGEIIRRIEQRLLDRMGHSV